MGRLPLIYTFENLSPPRFLQMVRDKKVHMEICPISSIQTGAVVLDEKLGWKSHPLVTFVRDGANYSVNTDDPTVCGVDLVTEYRRVATDMGLGVETLVKGVRNAVDATFLGAEEKAALRKKVEDKLKDLKLA